MGMSLEAATVIWTRKDSISTMVVVKAVRRGQVLGGKKP